MSESNRRNRSDIRPHKKLEVYQINYMSTVEAQHDPARASANI